MKIKIETAIAEKLWAGHRKITKKLISQVLENILNRYENLKLVKKYELSILLTDNSEMLRLNKNFRNKTSVTNVLSFPEINLKSQTLLEFQPNLNYMYLGDVAFGYQIIIDEAKEQGKSFEDHFLHLLVHSILHLLGYDHQNNQETKIMQKLEIEVLKDFNLPSPY